MAPMTRSRATNNFATDLMAKYYAQRASAGLIITEGTAPSPNGLGYARIPGLYNHLQAQAWSKVTSAVHAAGGKIFVQLMHTGRVSHAANMPAGSEVLGATSIVAPGQMYTDTMGMREHTPPRMMNEKDIHFTIKEYVNSSRLAIEAGFDGVEIHGANGYLIEQFINATSRTDDWGGSVKGRTHFTVELARQVAAEIGSDCTGIRLSPYGAFNGMTVDSDTDQVFLALAQELGQLKLSYLHLVDHSSMGAPPVPSSLTEQMKRAFAGSVILSGGYDRARAQADLSHNKGDLIAFARPFIANPNLVAKMQTGAELKAPDYSTFYTPGEKGYTDYAE